ncbi:hypothetical protein NMW79_00795 [Pasteurella multocida]|nr:hypothetical protein [Pasteurella multocida]HDR1088743.1 hypothetical protein [Pasteurella multocida]HDR1114512.1 hypothetical protein [Pasteurella multocida]HDR1886921.1 hypothetical protein [Pasteurella multocida]HDX1016625.1 hypothetical protein [Pasteurella multocida]
MNIGGLIERYAEIKRLRAELTKQDNELKAELLEIEASIMVELDMAGTDSATIRGVGTVFKTKEIVPSITDWDSFNTSVREQDLLFLFQRRLNASAYRSLLDQGVVVEGVEPTEITKVTFRKN